jgi:hypothetical protein
MCSSPFWCASPQRRRRCASGRLRARLARAVPLRLCRPRRPHRARARALRAQTGTYVRTDRFSPTVVDFDLSPARLLRISLSWQPRCLLVVLTSLQTGRAHALPHHSWHQAHRSACFCTLTLPLHRHLARSLQANSWCSAASTCSARPFTATGASSCQVRLLVVTLFSSLSPILHACAWSPRATCLFNPVTTSLLTLRH